MEFESSNETRRFPSSVKKKEFVNYSKRGRLERLDTSHAGITYYYDEDDDEYTIEDVSSVRRGGAKRIIKEFVSIIGKGKNIRSPIVEEETIARLRKEGYELKVQNGPTDITEKRTLKQLKMVRVFQGGGIKTDRVHVEEGLDEGVSDINVTYYGHT